MDRIQKCEKKFGELFGGKPVQNEGTDAEFMRILQRFIFGEVSIIGILLNVVLIPLSEILMLDSMLLAAVPDSSAGVFISKAAAGLMLDITAYFGKFSFSTAAVGSQYYSLLIFCVFVIFACAFFIKGSTGKRLFALSTAISCIFAVFPGKEIRLQTFSLFSGR